MTRGGAPNPRTGPNRRLGGRPAGHRRPPALTSAAVVAIVFGAMTTCGREATLQRDAGAAVFAVEASACGTGVIHRATAVAVGPEVVATVAHTFERAAAVQLVDRAGTAVVPVVVWLDPDRDLALLRLPEPHTTWLELGDTDDGAPIEVVTMGGDERPAVRSGRVVRHTPATLDGVGRRAALELEAVVRSGDSGSPVVTADGEVAGIVFAASRRGSGTATTDSPTADSSTVDGPGRAWALASTELAAAMDAAGTDPVPLAC